MLLAEDINGARKYLVAGNDSGEAHSGAAIC